MPLFRAAVQGGEWGAGASGRGDGAASPALTDGLSLHLHSVQLPRVILEQRCGLGTSRDCPPPRSHPAARWPLLREAGIKDVGATLLPTARMGKQRFTEDTLSAVPQKVSGQMGLRLHA